MIIYSRPNCPPAKFVATIDGEIGFIGPRSIDPQLPRVGRIYTEADLVTLALAVTADVRLIPVAEVGCTKMGRADLVARHVRCWR